MLFDRQDNRKQRQLAYRNQLKDQLAQKHSRIVNRNPDEYHPQGQAFSLITNIEKQQEQRKKKNSEYYDQLRRQIEEQKNKKKQAEAEKKRKELEEQNKLKEEQQRLQERYQQEMKKEQDKGRKKALTTATPATEETQKRAIEFPTDKDPYQTKKNEVLTKAKSYSYETPKELSQFRLSSPAQLPPVNLYPNRVENETFNFMTRKLYKNNYYQELLGQRRQMEEETHQISQMNRVFNFEKYRKKEQSRGIEELRSLYRMLDEKNADYIGLEKGQGKTKGESPPKSIGNKVGRGLSNSQKMNKDQWRKLD